MFITIERYEIIGPTTIFIQNGVRAYSMNNILTITIQIDISLDNSMHKICIENLV